MSIIGWIVVGLVAGGLARLVTGTEKQGCLGTIVVGILGALLGGALFRLATGDDENYVDGLNLGSILVAIVGSVALLLVLQAVGVRSRRR